MADLLRNPVLIVFTSLTICAAVPVIAHYWYRIRRAELDAILKQEMLARGLSADEIERVLRADSGRCWQRREAPRCRVRFDRCQ
jgi:hypothetical protein